ncbi:hypothetical protein WA026_013963 [Henosepilachna vigintioctopunctata]|uniref:Transmembrane protein n=1 Tax=Henosepilachna vigintioctopunctata TaxID=420089 RepID=A0AAW1UBB4_9CUCU
MGFGPNGSSTETTSAFLPPTPTLDPVELNKTRIAEEFYSTYDVMTGVRIAMTLGGFFAFMVILVLYKSKSETEKALEDPDFTAAAVADAEQEEERELAAVIEAEVFQKLNPRRSRQSIDNSCLSRSWIRSTRRYSSIGGYSSLMEPSWRMGLQSQLPSFDEDSTEDDPSFFDDVIHNRHLDVPRRCSNITCSSSGSSYLERRDSAFLLGMPAIPAHKSRSRRRQSSPLPAVYDFYYPIDIRVIQPTPGGSPCGSDRALYDRTCEPSDLKPRLAPLASISSCNSSLETEAYPDEEPLSCVSDSIFENVCDDTDNEVDEFSTDSELNDEQGACCSRQQFRIPRDNTERSLTPSIVSLGTTVRRSSRSSLTIVESPEEEFGVELGEVSASTSKSEDKSWAQEILF